MKKCPNCNQTFSDDNLFCLNDGATLLYLSQTSENPSVFPTPDNAPTQVFARPSQTAVSESSKWLYLMTGAMTVVIISLSAIVFFLLWGKENAENKSRENKQEISQTVEIKPSPKESNSARTSQVENQTSQIEKTNKQISIENSPEQTEPITSEAVQELINRWLRAQNARNYNAYKSCYAPQFFGIKRTRDGGESRMNYGQWMNDRRKMLKNAINVGIQNLDINLERDTATARFIQQFESVNYQDTGQKILKIKMFADGAKIIFEEMKYSY